MDFKTILNDNGDSTQPPPSRKQSFQSPSTPLLPSKKRPVSASEDSQPPPVKKQRIRPPWALRVDHGALQPMDEFVYQPSERRQRQAQPLTIDTNGARLSRTQPSTAVPQSARPWEATPAADFEWSLDNIVPFSDMTRNVANFLDQWVVLAPPEVLETGAIIEIEARLGVLVDPDTRERCSLPIETSAILQPNLGFRFESMMDQVCCATLTIRC
jgi:mRNA capping enzyme, beta chain